MPVQTTISVLSTPDSSTIREKAAALAAKNSLPLIFFEEQRQSEWLLAWRPEGLCLLHAPLKARKMQRRLFIDFVRGKNGYRLARDCSIQQPLARALGLKHGRRPTILDGTAGLGADAWVLAALGCQVTMCERAPILHALLADALQRAAAEPATAPTAARLELLPVDTTTCLAGEPLFQAIYLDPMYPQRRGSALNSLAMRTIRELVGNDEDSGDTLACARNHAPRVVVKRPRLAPFLVGGAPHHSIAAGQNRFDVYLGGVDEEITCGTVHRP